MMLEEGAMTYEQFHSACLAFTSLPQAQRDLWTLEGNPSEFGEAYLSRTFTKQLSPALVSFLSENDEQQEEKVSNVDEEEHSQGQVFPVEILQYRYDILYSVCHCVPQLYFTISKASGKLLSLEQVWKLLGLLKQVDSSSSSSRTFWDVVSIQDHPILHVSFFSVHPCNNWSLIKECFTDKDKNPTPVEFLISWMSVVLNHFGLNMSLNYFTEIKRW